MITRQSVLVLVSLIFAPVLYADPPAPCFEEPNTPVECNAPGDKVSCGGDECMNGECPAPPAGKTRGDVEPGPDLPDPETNQTLGYSSFIKTDAQGLPTSTEGYGGIEHDYICYHVFDCECELTFIAPTGEWKDLCLTQNTYLPFHILFFEGDYEWPCDELGPPPGA